MMNWRDYDGAATSREDTTANSTGLGEAHPGASVSLGFATGRREGAPFHALWQIRHGGCQGAAGVLP
jgi:hypothetical protein